MRDFFAWISVGVGKWILAILAFAAILPILAFYCDINTELLVGGYLPEDTYVLYEPHHEPAEFTIVKDAEHREGSLVEGHYYKTEADGMSYCTFYSGFAMHFHSGIESGVFLIDSNVLHKDGDVYYVTQSENRGTYLWFAPVDDPDAVARAAKLSGYSNSTTCS